MHPYPEYPEGLGGESAYYELDGPIDQVVRGLRRIVRDCKAHIEKAPALADTSLSAKLLEEAEEYLAERTENT